MDHRLTAGAARVDITPSTPQWLDGYGNRTAPSDGVYLPIHVRALYLADGQGAEALIISAEVLTIERVHWIRDLVETATGEDEQTPPDPLPVPTRRHGKPMNCFAARDSLELAPFTESGGHVDALLRLHKGAVRVSRWQERTNKESLRGHIHLTGLQMVPYYAPGVLQS